MQAYAAVTVPDPALDLPVPRVYCLHASSARDALTGLTSQSPVWDLVVLLCVKAAAEGCATI